MLLDSCFCTAKSIKMFQIKELYFSDRKKIGKIAQKLRPCGLHQRLVTFNKTIPRQRSYSRHLLFL